MTITTPVLPRPYSEAGLRSLTDHDWAQVPVTSLPIDALIPTQEAVAIEAVARWAEHPESLPARVVADNGHLWIHDGHTRWLILSLLGRPCIDAHVVDLNGAPLGRSL